MLGTPRYISQWARISVEDRTRNSKNSRVIQCETRGGGEGRRIIERRFFLESPLRRNGIRTGVEWSSVWFVGRQKISVFQLCCAPVACRSISSDAGKGGTPLWRKIVVPTTQATCRPTNAINSAPLSDKGDRLAFRRIVRVHRWRICLSLVNSRASGRNRISTHSVAEELAIEKKRKKKTLSRIYKNHCELFLGNLSSLYVSF